MYSEDNSIIRKFITTNDYVGYKNLSYKMSKIRNVMNLYSYLIQYYSRIFPIYYLKNDSKLQTLYKNVYKKNLDLQKQIIELKTKLNKSRDEYLFDIFLLEQALVILEKYIYVSKNYYIELQLILFEKTNHCMEISKHIMTFL